jgi:hypothetical protein
LMGNKIVYSWRQAVSARRRSTQMAHSKHLSIAGLAWISCADVGEARASWPCRGGRREGCGIGDVCSRAIRKGARQRLGLPPLHEDSDGYGCPSEPLRADVSADSCSNVASSDLSVSGTLSQRRSTARTSRRAAGFYLPCLLSRSLARAAECVSILWPPLALQ